MSLVNVRGVIRGGELDDDVALAGVVLVLDLADGLDGKLVVNDGAILHGARQEDLYLPRLDALGNSLRPARRGPRLDATKLLEPCGLDAHSYPFGE